MKLYNTLSRKVEDFRPISPKKVNFFVCGPTVYDLSHIGHAKTYIQMDTLARTLTRAGYEVFYLQNITDIDDKIIARAKQKNVPWQELSAQYEEAYLADMKTLNNTSVSSYARATDYIEDIIRQVQVLMSSNHAYQIERDGIYFEISTFKDYGKLSGRKQVKENDAESRIDQSEEKRGWNDFCLWKFSKPDEPSWKAPFGSGRPGWHIEDTAITEHHFGPQYDIHGGAVDLVFPHHEAELTQMEAASGKSPFVGYWVHTGFLNIDNKRMGKSLDNFFTIREVLEKGYDPLAIRLLMLQSHYRSALNFSWESLEGARARLKRWQNIANLQFQLLENVDDEGGSSEVLSRSQAAIRTALENDLDTPSALSAIEASFDALSDGVASYASSQFTDYLSLLDQLLGLNLTSQSDISDNQKDIIKSRQKARDKQDWKASDELRDELANQGLGVRDTPGATIWSRL